jgi:hypothetical protein
MLIKDQATAIRHIQDSEELAETRLEAVGFVFHGTMPASDGKRASAKAGSNLLHFARCNKLDKAGENETKFWFRSIRVAKQHLDSTVGSNRWKWCKICEREITQKILNEP